MALRCSVPAGSISAAAAPLTGSVFPMALRCSAPAGSVFPMVHPFRQIACLAGACCRARFPRSSMAPPASSISATAAPLAGSISVTAASLPAVLCADGSLPATASPQRPCQQQTLSAEKSTPVWLAIWHTWARFANSQHRDAAFATPDNICAHSSLLQTLSSCSDRRKSVGPSAPIAYATSVSPQDEAVA